MTDAEADAWANSLGLKPRSEILAELAAEQAAQRAADAARQTDLGLASIASQALVAADRLQRATEAHALAVAAMAERRASSLRTVLGFELVVEHPGDVNQADYDLILVRLQDVLARELGRGFRVLHVEGISQKVVEAAV